MSEPKTKAANLPTLPADLPENWVYAQTISPNGTEAGLTPQHGYNYLMQQVNQAQALLNQVTAILQEQGAEMATKDYVTEQSNLKVSKVGDTMTGPLLLPGNPTANLQAAPKQYVDTAVQPKANQADLNAHVNNKSNPHGVTAAQAGAVPTTRKVNNKALSGDIILTAADVEALGVNATAAAATKLATARTIRTNLASTSSSSFNGTANITPGVTGVLPVANGGTGSSTEKYLKLAGGVLQGDIFISKNIASPGVYNNNGAVFIGNNTSSGTGKVAIKLGDTDTTGFPRPVILRGVADPITDNDAANKGYVNSIVPETIPVYRGNLVKMATATVFHSLLGAYEVEPDGVYYWSNRRIPFLDLRIKRRSSGSGITEIKVNIPGFEYGGVLFYERYVPVFDSTEYLKIKATSRGSSYFNAKITGTYSSTTDALVITILLI